LETNVKVCLFLTITADLGSNDESKDAPKGGLISRSDGKMSQDSPSKESEKKESEASEVPDDEGSGLKDFDNLSNKGLSDRLAKEGSSKLSSEEAEEASGLIPKPSEERNPDPVGPGGLLSRNAKEEDSTEEVGESQETKATGRREPDVDK